MNDTEFLRMYKIIFTLAALWNICVGATGLLFQDYSIQLFYGTSALHETFIAMLNYRIVMLAIIIFGLGYFIVSRAPLLNRGIIWLGILSKLILFCIFTFYFFTGNTTIFAFLLVCGDMAWSLIFLYFLFKSSHHVKYNFLTG